MSFPTGIAGKRRYVGVTLTLVAALLLAACGGSGGGASDNALPFASGSASNTYTGPAPSGDPIKVMTEAPVNSQTTPYPNIVATAQVYEKYINANGGINGRPLKVIICDNKGDAGESANCARQAASDGAIANVGSFNGDMSRAIPIYEEEKIPWFGECCALVAAEYTSKISFPIGFGVGVGTAAAVKMAADGCKRPVGMYLDLPFTATFETAFENGWKSAGKDPADIHNVKIAPTAADYSAQAGQAADYKPDCVWGGIIGESNWPLLITAMTGVGSTPRYYGNQGNLNATVAKQFTTETNGAVFLGPYSDISGSQWAGYRDALTQYKADPKLDYNSAAGLGTWTAYTAFTAIVKTMTGEINNATFLDAASKATAVDTGGMVPPIDFSTEWTGGGGQFPRVFDRQIIFGTIKDGKIESGQTTPIDVTNAYDGKSS